MYILCIDQGTTGTTCGLLDCQSLQLVDAVNVEFRQIFPAASWVEHDLWDIWNSVEASFNQLLAKSGVARHAISAIGITNQRETACAFDGKGNPLANAIVWQDKRTHAFCQQLEKQYGNDYIRQLTGLPFDPYFSASKFRYLQDHCEAVQLAKKSGELRYGTIDTFLVYKLTGGQTYVTDATNASRTQLFDLTTGRWSDQLLSLFGLDIANLPQIVDSMGMIGETADVGFLPDGIPVCSILGDQQSSLFGQGGFEFGDLKATYGTGAFALANTGERLILSSGGLLSTVAFRRDGKLSYALEGACYTAGAAVQWFRDELGLIDSSSQIEELALEVSDLQEIEQLLCFPFLNGLGSPYWKPEATGSLFGLTRKTAKPHLARCLLEGLALSVNELLAEFDKELSGKVSRLKVDGGAAANNLLMQLQADFSAVSIERAMTLETTCLGAALAAAVGSGAASFDQISRAQSVERTFSPKPNNYIESKRALWRAHLDRFYLN